VQDYLVYFAFACFLAMSVCYFIAIPTAYRLGDVNVGLVKPWPTMVNDQISTIRLMFVTTVLFWVSLWSVKLSLLALYKKLIQGQPATYARFWWTPLLLLNCIQSLAGCIISQLTSCPDFRKTLSKGECPGSRSVRGQIASLYTAYAMDVVSDLMSTFEHQSTSKH
jgi:hypothetical protein